MKEHFLNLKSRTFPKTNQMKILPLFILTILSATSIIAQTPSLVVDVKAGTSDSEPRGLIAVDTTLYFKGYHTDLELYKYTPNSGCKRLTSISDIYGVAGTLKPLTIANDKLVFGYGIIPGAKLHYLDASDNPIEITVGYTHNLSPIHELGGRVYYDGQSTTTSNCLCYLDEWNALHTAVDYTPFSDYIFEMVTFDNKIFYTTSRTTHKLYVYDPATDNNSLVSAVTPAGSGTRDYPKDLYVGDDNVLYFKMYSESEGCELYSYTTSGTLTQLTHLNGIGDGVMGSLYPVKSYSNLIKFGNSIYFPGTDDYSLHGWRLMKYDLSSGTTSLVADINPTPLGADPTDFFIHGGNLYFSANNDTNGREMWVTDGTTTKMVADINPGPASSNPSGYCFFNGGIYFSATDGVVGKELFRFSVPNGVQSLANTTTNIALAPNPTSDIANLTFQLKKESELYVIISDMQGRTLFKTIPKKFAVGASTIELHLNHYPSGNYMYTLMSSSEGFVASGVISHRK